MKKKLSSCVTLIGSISLILCLTLATLAQADEITSYTSSGKITVTFTTFEEGTKDTFKLVTTHEAFDGTATFYWDNTAELPATADESPTGCTLLLVAAPGTTGTMNGAQVCFTSLYGLPYGTINKAEKEWVGNLVGNATGTLSLPVGTPAVLTQVGTVYTNFKGSVAINASKEVTSLKVGATFGGGYIDPATGDYYIFSGTLPTTTYK